MNFATGPICIDALVVGTKRLPLLRKCVESLEAASRLANIRLRIVVFINGSGADDLCSEDFLWLQTRPKVSLLIHHGVSLNAGVARNILIDQMQAEWAFFVDDDAYVREDIFQIFIARVRAETQIALVGGPNLSPKDSSKYESINGAVLASFWGTLWSNSRYRPVGKLRVANEAWLTSCNLFVRDEVLQSIRYPDNYKTAEESHFLNRALLNYQGRCFYDPHLIVYHRRRSTMQAFAKQIYGYATGRAQMILEGQGFNPWHFIPSLGLTFVSLAAADQHLKLLILVSFLIYLLAGLVFALKAALELRRPLATLLIFLSFPLAHFSYALGLIAGLMKPFFLALNDFILF